MALRPAGTAARGPISSLARRPLFVPKGQLDPRPAGTEVGCRRLQPPERQAPPPCSPEGTAEPSPRRDGGPRRRHRRPSGPFLVPQGREWVAGGFSRRTARPRPRPVPKGRQYSSSRRDGGPRRRHRRPSGPFFVPQGRQWVAGDFSRRTARPRPRPVPKGRQNPRPEGTAAPGVGTGARVARSSSRRDGSGLPAASAAGVPGPNPAQSRRDGRTLPPEVALIIADAVPLKQGDELLLEVHSLVMLLLVSDVG